jgi:tetratricopeptide (TPR) repeat protein
MPARPKESDLPRTPGSPRPLGPWPWALAALGLFTWRGAFTTYFAQDDFHWLLLAAGSDPTPLWAPRFLSQNFYFRALTALTGANPVAFHAVAVALFIAAGLLMHRVLARPLGSAVAAGAVALWLTSPAFFDAVYWPSEASEVMGALFLAGTVLLVASEGPERDWRRWTAPLVFGLALASKETAVGAAPAIALLDWRKNGASGLMRAPLYFALAALQAGLALGPHGVSRGEAYALRPLAVLHNLPAYMTLSLGSWATARSASDFEWARSSFVLGIGWALLAVWVALLIRRRSAHAWIGSLWFFGTLSPVLLLDRQYHFYYALCALPGLYASIALIASGWGGAIVARAVAVACAVLVATQVLAVQVRQTARLAHAPLYADFVLRRAHVARNALDDLEAQEQKLRPRVVLIGQQPVETSAAGVRTTISTDYGLDPFLDANVWAALGEGAALRWRFPQVREVGFRRWLAADDSNRTVLAFAIDGHLQVTDYASYAGVAADSLGTLAARIARAQHFIERRMFEAALGELEAARSMAPGNVDVLLNLGTLQAVTGDTAAAVQTLAKVVERFPHDPEARFNLGLLYWRTGRLSEARDAWAPMLAESPESDLAARIRSLLEGRAH